VNVADVEDTLRQWTPRVLAQLIRQYGDFDRCEDAVQEALLDAHLQWSAHGIPASPGGWLTRVAQRRWIESVRQDTARRAREHKVSVLAPDLPGEAIGVDDTLSLLMLCCNPALTRASQVALTLRAVGGLTTPEIARAFLVPESTIGQRISRAKRTIARLGVKLSESGDEWPDRRTSVLSVLYLIFNEGYTASSGVKLQRVDLSEEAIRLTRQLHDRAPSGEVTGLLALMLLTDARRPARTADDGSLVPLGEQDRTRWDRHRIDEGLALVRSALTDQLLGPFQIQAAIAAVHDEAATTEETDWPQIHVLYRLLEHVTPGPMVTLGRVVAHAMTHGPESGIVQLDLASNDTALTRHHRSHAVRGHLLEMLGHNDQARIEYESAARKTLSGPEQRYLLARAQRLT
jgi:predicted RNA polymerase sigma factor